MGALIGVLAMVIGVLVVVSVAQVAPTEDRLLCANSEDRERMRALMLEALDNGFREHTAHLVDILIKDRKDQPGRAMRGMQPALIAYVKGRGAIAAFNPPPCERMDYPHAQ